MCSSSTVRLANGETKQANHDRFYAWIGSDELVHWWCRSSSHEFTEKALFKFLGIDFGTQDYSKFVGRQEMALPAPTEADYSGNGITMDDVDLYRMNRPEYVLGYWAAWSIDQTMVEQMGLGYIDRPGKAGGRWAGFTIPHFYTTAQGEILVRAIQVRRDDAIKNNEIPDKYRSVAGSNLAGIYYDSVVCSPDQKRIAKPLDWLFVGEDERTALCLNTIFRHMGMRSVAAICYHPEERWDKHLFMCLRNAGFIFVLQDNEPNKEDGTNPGAKRAEEIKKLAGNNTAIIKPTGYKQYSDMAKETHSSERVWDDLETQVIRHL